MKYGLPRQLLSVAILPFTIAVLVPLWLVRRNDTQFTFGDTPRDLALQLLGVIVLAFGIFLFSASLRRFATDGEGTLAPWDPPRRLVVSGLYRYVRNPMISGVIFIVTGEAIALWSRSIAEWAVIVLLINAVYIPLSEEPMLAQRFGEPYREYCRHVRRFLPRLTPWRPDEDPDRPT